MRKMYVLIRKCTHQVTVYSDLTAVAEEMGVVRDTARSRLPYYEDADMIFSQSEYVKSKRGRK